MLSLAAVFALATAFSCPVPAATSANANTPLGINLNFLSYYDPEQPLLNIFKTTAITQSNPMAWSTRTRIMAETHEEAYLQLDSSGYPTTLTASSSDPNSPQEFTQACALILRMRPSNAGMGPPYRAGQYVVLYDGVGTIQVRMDAKMVSTSQTASGGRDVFDVATPTRNGVWICISDTNPKNHLRNIRVVKAEEESLLDQGQVFTPTFLDLLKNFRVIRAMQWLKIDEKPGPPGVWADRPQLSDAGWGSGKGAPLEAVVSLCNALSADCWINFPVTADDDYITQAATLVHQQLGATQNVYVELSNEVWNGIYSQHQYAVQQGEALWPRAKNPFEANRNWYGMRTAQMCDMWAQAWGGDFSRVHCVLGAFTVMPRSATDSLDCPLWSGAPCYKHHITDVAIAPYVGWPPQKIPSDWRTADSSALVNYIFAEFNAGQTGGYMTDAVTGFSGGKLLWMSNWEGAYRQALAPYHLRLVAYEGGQSLQGVPGYPDGSNVVNAYIAANRDPRMADVYTKALESWKANGGETYVLYDDVYSPNKYGAWGLLESSMDNVSPLSSAPPKWRAVQEFIANNPCWWPGCAGKTASVPMTPSGFKKSN